MKLRDKILDRINKSYSTHYASQHDGSLPDKSWGNSVLEWYARHFMNPLSTRGLEHTRPDLVECFYWYAGDRMLKFMQLKPTELADWYEHSKLVSQVREAERKFVAKGTQHLVVVMCVALVAVFGLISYLPWGPSLTEQAVTHLLNVSGVAK